MVNLPFEFVINSTYKRIRRTMNIAFVGAEGNVLFGKASYNLNEVLEADEPIETSRNLLL